MDKNKEDLDNFTLKKDKILNYTLTQAEVVHQLTLIDDEINKAYKLKGIIYRSFDNISKDEMNDYDMEKELNSIIKQFRYSQIEEMKEVADTLNN